MPRECFLSPDEGATLLRIAHESVSAYVQDNDLPGLETYPLTPTLRELHGVFVTLRQSGELRGCHGYTKSLEPLAQAVRECTINAAARDPRFTPVRLDELPTLQIEIAALCPGATPDSPFIPVHDLAELVLGEDGLYLEHAGPRGGALLLPHAAAEHCWTLEQFLEALCRQAGIAPGCWQDPSAVLYRFSTQVFAEG